MKLKRFSCILKPRPWVSHTTHCVFLATRHTPFLPDGACASHDRTQLLVGDVAMRKGRAASDQQGDESYHHTDRNTTQEVLMDHRLLLL